jgi:hypothetical protein
LTENQWGNDLDPHSCPVVKNITGERGNNIKAYDDVKYLRDDLAEPFSKDFYNDSNMNESDYKNLDIVTDFLYGD